VADARRVACGVCGRYEPRVVGVPPVSERAKALTPAWESMRVVQCRECGFYYTDPMPFWEAKDLQLLYADDYVPRYAEWWLRTRRHVDPQRRLSLIQSHMNMTGSPGTSAHAPRFLDVGCGPGYALEAAIDGGWEAHGLEPSESQASQTTRRLDSRANVHIETIEDTRLPSAYFDAIYMDSVLEHLPDPSAAVRTLYRMLRGGGLAYILVPNEDRFAYVPAIILRRLNRRKETPKLCPLANPYHIVGFNRGTLIRLFQQNGFRVRHISVFRGVEPHKKTIGDHIPSIKGKLYRSIEEAAWSIGGLIGRGAQIEAIFEKCGLGNQTIRA